MKKRIILASGSPRRFDILTAHGVAFEVMTADVDDALTAIQILRPPAWYLALEKSACGKEKDRERSDHSCGYHRGI